jgi:hypothetical protein
MKLLSLSITAVLAIKMAVATGEESLPQFKAWGTVGHELAPVQPGWVEVPSEPRHRSEPVLTEEEAANGFMVFQRRPFEPIYHDTVSAAFERGVVLQAIAAQGEYEPLTFAIHARKAQKGLRVTCEGLKTRQGAQIPASYFDIRLVRSVRCAVKYGDPKDRRYYMAPFYLEKRASFDIDENRTAQIWLTVQVPADAKAGDYEGTVSVLAGPKTAAQVPVRIRVLPFHLPPMPIETALSYSPPADTVMREKEMIDQREHGINGSESGSSVKIVTRDRKFGDDDANATRQAIKADLALRCKVYGAEANRFPITIEAGHQILYYWDQKKNWFEYWPHTPEAEADFFKALRLCQETVRAQDGPPMRFFIMDEPGGHPDLLSETVRWYKLAKEKMPQIQTYVTTGGGQAMGIDEIGLLGPYVDFLAINRFDDAICRRLLERGKPYGVYNGGGATETITGYTRDRYFFGFYGWKTGASGILQWAYRFGDAWKDPIRGNHGYIMSAADGPLPSIPWEGIREGLDDYRYMDLLWRLITAARNVPAAAEAARAGEKVTAEIMGVIAFTYQPLAENGTPAPSSAMLEKWRWKVAAACIDLLRVVSLETALAATAKRPGPSEWPAVAAEGGTTYGPELLVGGGFENGAGPWKAAAGKGAGKGGLDHAVAHVGKASFAIENPKDATGMDVVVCVWGWGGPGPDMMLGAGKTYEFSAYVKHDAGQPQMRLELPDGTSIHSVDGGGPADAAGWHRLWKRVTVAKDAKPKYLAVWLQGPGKVWTDDLSLREVIVPPFEFDTPQTLIDGSDRSITVRLRQFGQTKVSVRVLPPGKNSPQMVDIPGQGEADVEFDPRGLALGAHELKVEMTGGIVPFSKTIKFIRVAGPFENP